jgi:uncharacterized protein YraI
MMSRLILKRLWIGLSCILFSMVALAQESCPALVQSALATTGDVCADISAGTLCYGHPSVNAEINANPAFAVPGDVTNLSDVTSIQLSALDENRAEWGVIAAQVDVPNAPVTLVAFGDTRIKNESAAVVQPEEAVYAPMQKFHLHSGHDDAPCAGSPQSGVLLQAAQDAEAEIIINDIPLFLNGTAFIQNDQPLLVSVLDGQVRIEANSTSLRVFAGGRAVVSLDNNETPITVEPYNPSDLASLPLMLLPRAVTLSSPLTEDQISAEQNHCHIVSRTAVNVRTGPSTLYPKASALEAGGSYVVTAQANGLDGKIWWLLENGGWVRSDVVKAEDSCQQVMVTTDFPPTPTPVPTQSPTQRYVSMDLSSCQLFRGAKEIHSGDVMTFMMGPNINKPTREEAEAAIGNTTSNFAIDNTPQTPIEPMSITQDLNGFHPGTHYVWIATPGTHTLAGGWSGFWQQTCVITVGD